MLDFQYGGVDAFLNEVVICIRNKDFFREVLNVSLSVVESEKRK